MTQHYDRLSTPQLEHECNRLKASIGDLETALARAKNEYRSALEERDRRLRPAPHPAVTDHAVLRYIERVIGIDVQKIRQDMLSESNVAAIKAGAKSITVGGIKFTVAGNKIVTTYPTEHRPS